MSKNSGYVVETKSGKGYTVHSDASINGKVVIYLDTGMKILCNPDNVKVIGFKD